MYRITPTCLTLVLLLVGCGTEYHREAVDKEVYAILQQAESEVFGQSSQFHLGKAKDKAQIAGVTPKTVLQKRLSAPGRTLTLDEAIGYAIENSREYQSQKERLYLAGLSLSSARNQYRSRFFGRTQLGFRRTATEEEFGTADSEFGLDRAFVTGGRLGLALANDLLRYFTGSPRENASSLLSLNVFQPLLRGAGPFVAAEQLTQANRNVIYEVRSYTHFQNTFTVSIVNEYFSLLQLKQIVYNEYQNYQSRLENEAYLRAREDREQPEAIDNAVQDTLFAKNRYLEAVGRYQTALDGFKITLGYPVAQKLKLDTSEIAKIRKEGIKQVNLSPNAAFRIALASRLPLFNQIDRFEDRKRQIALAADRLRADLGFRFRADLDSSGGPTDYTRFNFQEVRTTTSLALDLPLDRLRERNDYRATLINFESAIRELGQDFDELRALIGRRLRELRQFQESFEIQQNAVALAQRRVEGNRLRLQAGRIIFRRLSEAQDSLIRAQNAETRALVSAMRSRLNLLVELGVLDASQPRFWLSDLPEIVQRNSTPAKSEPLVPLTVDDEVIPPDLLF